MDLINDWSVVRKLEIDETKVSGSTDFTDHTVLITEDVLSSIIFSNAQGQEIYTNRFLNDSALEGYWRLEDGTDESSNGYDLSGTAPTYTTGRFGNGGDFESGSLNYLNIADASCPNLEISGSQTWSIWVKPETLRSQRLMAKTPSSRSNPRTLYMTGTGGAVSFYLAGLSPANVSSDVTLAAGSWFHVVGVYDADEGKIKIWVNGVKKEVSATGTLTDANGDFGIGCDGGYTSGDTFDGMLDDAAIWSRAFTDDEVMELYRGGADLRFTTDALGTDVIPHEVVKFDTTNSVAEVHVKLPDLYATANTPFYIWAGNSSIDAIGREIATAHGLYDDANLQGYWRLENTSYTDESGNGYDLSGTTRGAVVGKFGNGSDFESSSSDYVSIVDGACPNLEITGSKTWSLWFKPESISLQVLMSKVSGTSGVQIFFDTSYIQFYHNGTTTGTVNSSTAMVVGRWYHIVGVYDSSAGKLKIFVNGVKTEVSATGSSSDSNAPFYLGRNDAGNYADGILDDAAIWNRALTDVEVAEIYGNGRGAWRSSIKTSHHMNNLLDSTVNKVTLANTGASPGATGLFGEGYTFVDSENDKMALNNSVLNLAGDQTWMILVKPTGINGDGSDRLLWDTDGATYNRYLDLNSSENFQVSGNQVVTTSNTTTISDNNWYLVGWIKDDTNNLVKVAVNKTRGSNTDTNTYSNYAGAKNIAGNGQMDCVVGEIRFYSESISDDEWDTVYNNFFSPATFMTESAVSDISAVAGVAQASISKVSGVSIANIKKISGISN